MEILFFICHICYHFLFNSVCLSKLLVVSDFILQIYYFYTLYLYMNYTIRKIEAKDNATLAQIIRNIFEELNAPKVGTAYADPHLDNLSEVYQAENEAYFVVEFNGEVKGGAGIAPLTKEMDSICELQKMYFDPEIRGFGIAQELLKKCLEFAKQAGYNKCYLETLPYMEAAQKLYKKFDFEYIKAPMGDTGHSSCHVFMLKDLE